MIWNSWWCLSDILLPIPGQVVAETDQAGCLLHVPFISSTFQVLYLIWLLKPDKTFSVSSLFIPRASFQMAVPVKLQKVHWRKLKDQKDWAYRPTLRRKDPVSATWIHNFSPLITNQILWTSSTFQLCSFPHRSKHWTSQWWHWRQCAPSQSNLPFLTRNSGLRLMMTDSGSNSFTLGRSSACCGLVPQNWSEPLNLQTAVMQVACWSKKWGFKELTGGFVPFHWY